MQIDDPACCDGEMTLDIEAVGAMANSGNVALDSPHVYTYEGGGTHLSDLLDAWEDQSADAARVGTTSFGAFEDQYGGLGNPSISDFSDAINAMTAVGWSLVAAAGDHGAYDDCEGLSVGFPASSPNVVAVGGTTLTMTNNGGKPKYASEVAWTGNGCGGSDWPGSNNGGGGGGCADTEPAGFWQAIVTLPCQKRALPDIAMNSGTGVSIYWLGQWRGIGGTSAAAPEFAGFLARENAYLSHLGNVAVLRGTVRADRHAERDDVADGQRGDRRERPQCLLRHHERLQRRQPGPGPLHERRLRPGHGLGLDQRPPTRLGPDGRGEPRRHSGGHVQRCDREPVVQRRPSRRLLGPGPEPQGTFASVGIAGHTAQWDAVVADPKATDARQRRCVLRRAGVDVLEWLPEPRRGGGGLPHRPRTCVGQRGRDERRQDVRARLL